MFRHPFSLGRAGNDLGENHSQVILQALELVHNSGAVLIAVTIAGVGKVEGGGVYNVSNLRIGAGALIVVVAQFLHVIGTGRDVADGVGTGAVGGDGCGVGHAGAGVLCQEGEAACMGVAAGNGLVDGQVHHLVRVGVGDADHGFAALGNGCIRCALLIDSHSVEVVIGQLCAAFSNCPGGVAGQIRLGEGVSAVVVQSHVTQLEVKAQALVRGAGCSEGDIAQALLLRVCHPVALNVEGLVDDQRAGVLLQLQIDIIVVLNVDAEDFIVGILGCEIGILIELAVPGVSFRNVEGIVCRLSSGGAAGDVNLSADQLVVLVSILAVGIDGTIVDVVVAIFKGNVVCAEAEIQMVLNRGIRALTVGCLPLLRVAKVGKAGAIFNAA